MARIPLTRGLFATVDDDDFVKVSAFKWYAQPNGCGQFYAARRAHHKGPLIYMHRFVASTPAGLFADHIDGDTLNNSKANLRAVTPAQNSMNKRTQKGQTLKGAWLDASTNGPRKWRAAIRLNGRLKYLGRFASQAEAAAAYSTAAQEHFGEFNRSEP